MFRKILIANRGEIATRIIHTCRDMGILTLALYEAPDRGSLHVRRADEAVRLESAEGFRDQAAILEIARTHGVDAIHPGYGFLAEEEGFIQACEAAGIAFIGPSASLVHALRSKIEVLRRVREAGFATVAHSYRSFAPEEYEALREAADRLGYPLVVKSARGWRGPGERLVRAPEGLEEAVRRAQAEAQSVYGNQHVYLEKAVLPAHQVNVQVLGDSRGKLLHLGEREGSLMTGNRKVIEEAPAPCLSSEQRQRLWDTALRIASLFHYEGAGTVEFLVDAEGRQVFTEIKARIQTEHPLAEMVCRVDLVREQIRVESGEPIALQQEDVLPRGCAILCRINAEDPLDRSLASPGYLRRVRLPSGPEIRVDTYVYSHTHVPLAYNPLIMKLTVWGPDREACIGRLRRALEDLTVIGTSTNLPLIQHIVSAPAFVQGTYDTAFLGRPLDYRPRGEQYYRDLAVAVAVYYMRRHQTISPSIPERLLSGWHRETRRFTS